MKKNLLLTITLAALCAFAQSSQAITINMTIGYLYDNGGITKLVANSTLVLLADTTGDGWGDLTLANSFTGGQADNLVLGRWALDGTLDGDGTGSGSINFNLESFGGPAGLTSGDNLLLVWYDTAYNAGATGPGAGIDFGYYRTDSVINNSDIAWAVPSANNFGGNLNLLTVTGGGDTPDALAAASFQTVPEPSSTMLVLGGLGMLGVIRRFRKQH